MDCDALIIGAGPVGSSLASRLSSFGLKVAIADRKTAIGKHACSGLFSKRITKYIDIDNGLVENVVDGAIFHTKNCDFEVRKGGPEAFVMDRVKFDRSLLKRAIESGTSASLGSRFVSCELDSHICKSCLITHKGPQSITSKLIIGADGAASTVRRAFNLRGDLRYVNGILSYCQEKNTSSLVELYYSPDIAPGFFAWKIPRGTRTELGLATDTSHNHLDYFKKFLKKFNLGLTRFYAHPICFGNQETVSVRALLIGDAAAQVKPFSGGGIIYGLLCADIAAKAISRAFDKNDFSKEFLKKHYEDKWKEKLMPKIETGLAIRNILDSLSDRELDTFFDTFKEQKNAIETLGDMDFL